MFFSKRRGCAGRIGPIFPRVEGGTPKKIEGDGPQNLKQQGAALSKKRFSSILFESVDCLATALSHITRSPLITLSLSLSLSSMQTVQQKISRTTVSATPSSINQIGFQTPPSTGEKPAWDAIIEVGGSQQFVSEGRYYECHSLPGLEPGSKVAFERVLATRDTDKPTFGQPYVKGARVEATVLENYKDEKVIVFKYRPKKHYRRKNGHRQHMTRFLVTKVIKA